jgi:hypothetical protein
MGRSKKRLEDRFDGLEVSVIDAAHDSCCINQERRWIGPNKKRIVGSPTRILSNQISGRKLGNRAPNHVFGFDGQGQDARLGVAGLQFRQLRNFAQTGAAPGRKKRQNEGFPQKGCARATRQRGWFVIAKGLERKRGRGLANEKLLSRLLHLVRKPFERLLIRSARQTNLEFTPHTGRIPQGQREGLTNFGFSDLIRKIRRLADRLFVDADHNITGMYGVGSGSGRIGVNVRDLGTAKRILASDQSKPSRLGLRKSRTTQSHEKGRKHDHHTKRAATNTGKTPQQTTHELSLPRASQPFEMKLLTKARATR